MANPVERVAPCTEYSRVELNGLEVASLTLRTARSPAWVQPGRVVGLPVSPSTPIIV